MRQIFPEPVGKILIPESRAKTPGYATHTMRPHSSNEKYELCFVKCQKHTKKPEIFGDHLRNFLVYVFSAMRLNGSEYPNSLSIHTQNFMKS
jgi:hypothetical protein